MEKLSLKLSLIVAVANNGVIGHNNKLPWHIPEDLKWFKKNTLNKPMIMGRKTFESLGRPLPGRPHIVVTRNPDFSYDGVITVTDIEKAIDAARNSASEMGANEVMLIGGANLYQQMLPQIDRIYRTLVDLEPEGDAYFPELGNEWVVASEEKKCSNDINFLLQVVEKVS